MATSGGTVLLTEFGTPNTSGQQQRFTFSSYQPPIPSQVCVVVHLIPPVAAPPFRSKVDLEELHRALPVRLAQPPAILSISPQAEKATRLRRTFPFTIQPGQALFGDEHISVIRLWLVLPDMARPGWRAGGGITTESHTSRLLARGG